jgi:hypothetical protein
MVSGSARKNGDTHPPKVASDHRPMKRMKNAAPSPTRARGGMGSSGRGMGRLGNYRPEISR